ncbi:unnamed protein product [Lymnaea stagnalis]|uniref:Caveolin n=1 Tax=Lymnaea stagnalis TaxID=6523 RepID=A0AAV2HE41_LYMST
MMSSTNVRLEVSSEAVQTNEDVNGGPNVTDRDPLKINSHLKVNFENIFAEPDPEVSSFDTVWSGSLTVFTQTRLWCYKISTLFCALPLAFFWGVHFGFLACCTVWCCRPCKMSYDVKLGGVRGFVQSAVDAIYRPCFEAFGHIFYNIRIKTVREEI